MAGWKLGEVEELVERCEETEDGIGDLAKVFGGDAHSGRCWEGEEI